MSEKYQKILGDLRHEIVAGEAQSAVIDAKIEEILMLPCSRLPNDLLLLLSDTAPYDESMYSLIHAAESFEDDRYASALLSIFPDLMVTAPKWALVVLTRALNDGSTRREVVKRLPTTSERGAKAIGEMCNRITKDCPELLTKTWPVTAALSSKHG